MSLAYLKNFVPLLRQTLHPDSGKSTCPPNFKKFWKTRNWVLPISSSHPTTKCGGQTKKSTDFGNYSCISPWFHCFMKEAIKTVVYLDNWQFTSVLKNSLFIFVSLILNPITCYVHWGAYIMFSYHVTSIPNFHHKHQSVFSWTMVYGLVAKMTKVHTLIVVAANQSWPILQMDAKNTFLHDDRKKTFYMHPPKETWRPLILCLSLLQVSLWTQSLKAAPNAELEKFRTTLINFGFKQSYLDHSHGSK